MLATNISYSSSHSLRSTGCGDCVVRSIEITSSTYHDTNTTMPSISFTGVNIAELSSRNQLPYCFKANDD